MAQVRYHHSKNCCESTPGPPTSGQRYLALGGVLSQLLYLRMLLLEGRLALLFLQLLEWLLGLRLLTFLTVTADFFLQNPPFSSTLYP